MNDPHRTVVVVGLRGNTQDLGHGERIVIHRLCFNGGNCQWGECEVLWLAALPLPVDNIEVHFGRMADRWVTIGRDLNEQQTRLTFIFVYCCLHLPNLLSIMGFFHKDDFGVRAEVLSSQDHLLTSQDRAAIHVLFLHHW